MSKKSYTYWMAAPGVFIYVLIFAIPTFASFYFSMTRWNLMDSVFIGFDNFKTFFSQTNTKASISNTFLFAFTTSFSKVILGMLIAMGLCGKIKSASYLKSVIFFPTLLGNVAVGIAFASLMHPSHGLINQALTAIGLQKVKWLTDPDMALWSVMLVDFWKGIGVTTVIYIAGISSIPLTYYEAAAIDGASRFQRFKSITLPLLVPSINSVLTLSLIGGFKNYDLIWTMTEGGPGYATETLGTVVYKLFARGNYGLATAGNVILFILIAFIIYPVNTYVSRKEVEL